MEIIYLAIALIVSNIIDIDEVKKESRYILPTKATPTSISLSRNGSRVFVSDELGGQYIIENNKLSAVSIKRQIECCCSQISPDGRVYVVGYANGELALVVSDDNSVAATVNTGSSKIALLYWNQSTETVIAINGDDEIIAVKVEGTRSMSVPKLSVVSRAKSMQRGSPCVASPSGIAIYRNESLAWSLLATKQHLGVSGQICAWPESKDSGFQFLALSSWHDVYYHYKGKFYISSLHSVKVSSVAIEQVSRASTFLGYSRILVDVGGKNAKALSFNRKQIILPVIELDNPIVSISSSSQGTKIACGFSGGIIDVYAIKYKVIMRP